MSPLRFRLVTAGLVVTFLAATHLIHREPEARSVAQYLFVITLGYGHLLGAALRRRRRARASLAGRAFALVTIAIGFALYREGVVAWPGLAVALLALSVWHFTENDIALAAALRTGTATGPLTWSVRAQAAPFAAAAAIVAAALLSAPDPGLLGDLFAGATLFHLVGWLVFLLARGTSPRRLAALHAPAFLLSGGLLAAPEDAALWLRDWLLSPAVYLYWASLHVADTLLGRGVARAAERVTWLNRSTS